MAELQVGDIVIVLPRMPTQRTVGRPRWTQEMSKSVGNEYIILDIKPISSGMVCASIRLSTGLFWYSLNWLMLAKDYHKKIGKSGKNKLDDKQKTYISKKIEEIAHSHIHNLDDENKREYKPLSALSKKYSLKTIELKEGDLMKLISDSMVQALAGRGRQRTLSLPPKFKVDEILQIYVEDLIPNYNEMLYTEMEEAEERKEKVVQKTQNIWDKAENLSKVVLFGTKNQITKELTAFSKLKV